MDRLYRNSLLIKTYWRRGGAEGEVRNDRDPQA